MANQLALERTLEAHERTLMAWIRTATSLITFGFTIYKFFEFQIEKKQAVLSHRILGPREFGMLMISIGIVALVLATIQQGMTLRRMSAEYGWKAFSLSMLVAGLVAALGAFAFLAALYRL